jgi:Kdo2-lipid IVA lauroyltransferase/acyltransferase
MSEWFVKTRKWIELAALVFFAKLIKFCALITPYRLGVWAGGILGFCAYYLATRERKRAIEHLSSAFGDKDEQWIRCTARRNFVHLGKSVFECSLITPRRLERIFDLHGVEALRTALQRGKGAIYVTGHIGNWELMAYSGVAHGVSLSVVAAPIRPKQVNDMITGLRSRMGVKTIVRSKPGAVRELIRIFKENRILAVLIDQDTDVEGAFVDFMGRPAWTPTAAASMAIKFNAPILFGYTYRDQHNRHVGNVEGPIELIRTGNDEQDIVANTALLTKKIEQCVRNNPEQWVWMHRRWRRQP